MRNLKKVTGCSQESYRSLSYSQASLGAIAAKTIDQSCALSAGRHTRIVATQLENIVILVYIYIYIIPIMHIYIYIYIYIYTWNSA